MRKFCITIFLSVLITNNVEAGVRGSLVRSGNSRTRLAGGKKIRSSGLTKSSTVSSDTIDEVIEDKDKKTCEEIVFSCMDKKTTEYIMQNESLYTDYNDMLTEIYSGMVAPSFKCVYSNELKSLYSKYYYNKEITAPNKNRAEKIKTKSIEYYNFLKQNATDIATKKKSAQFIQSDVLKYVGILSYPKSWKPQDLPDVSYKITAIDPNVAYEENIAYCVDETKNEELQGCPVMSAHLGEKWKEAGISVNKSCKDYEIYLSEKRSKAETAAKDFILTLKEKISSVIEEHNLKIEAGKQLENIKEEENIEIDYMKP